MRVHPVVTAGDVLFEALAKGMPFCLVFRARLLKEGLHDEQGWNAHEDRSVAALNLLLELR